jgi:methylmalonyl-CoA mutase
MQEERRDKLFTEFPPVSAREWEDKIREDLKGADYDKKLIWQTVDGIKVRPYYREEDLAELPFLNSLPDEFPFIRGYKTGNNDWDICQEIVVKSPRTANSKALSLLDKGITSPKFIISERFPENISDLELLLDGINLQTIPVHFGVSRINPSLLKLFHEVVIRKGFDPSGVSGSADFDPFGFLFRTGNFYEDKEKDLALLKESLDFVRINLPSFRVISVSAGIFHQAGATISQELGLALATGTEYLDALTDRGLKAEDISRHIFFGFSTGSDYFPEIAKLRSARTLWSVVTRAFMPATEDHGRMVIHSATSSWNQTIFDPYNNLLRATTEAMSAILGSADVLMVLPYDFATGSYGEFSERLARNIQLILREEAYFNKVADPASGSYYIENLTDKISENAWKIFTDIEKEGGVIKAFSGGLIQEMIGAAVREKMSRISQRKDKIVGINRYPAPGEQIKVEPKIHKDEANHADEWIGRPLLKTRAASDFEQLRMRTGKLKKIPSVFLLTYGDPVMRRARAAFSSDFFACAGFEIIDNNGFESFQEGLSAAVKSTAEIIVLCSSDNEYVTAVPPAVKELKGKAILVIAGYPEKIAEQLKAEGIEYFIHLRSDVLKELEKILNSEF